MSGSAFLHRFPVHSCSRSMTHTYRIAHLLSQIFSTNQHKWMIKPALNPKDSSECMNFKPRIRRLRMRVRSQTLLSSAISYSVTNIVIFEKKWQKMVSFAFKILAVKICDKRIGILVIHRCWKSRGRILTMLDVRNRSRMRPFCVCPSVSPHLQAIYVSAT